ncbi:conserved hypothetical protein [Methylomarinovum caldicuralii]|uniref:Ribonuclease VapC n=1 Tax=Methylomarinovum caldicuralii TaxID=438856 RepID=A0AAU9BQU6_9GAMM|nr:TA system VapC family ribonuclease toxin [Methylomarinovum caldicuralii]BCX80846.1 conserved hypothetical protein [Methylomarinovum caldicuralii]
MRALLDVNVLIALLDGAHSHHGLAKQWLAAELDQGRGWASCPITQNGCVRIMSSPAYPGNFTPVDVALRLSKAVAHPSHQFWAADVNLLDGQSLDWQKILGHRQITDAYLLALAVHHKGRFVTFDRRVSTTSVPGAGAAHLCILG